MAMDKASPVGTSAQSIPTEIPILQPSSMISRADVRTGSFCVNHTASPLSQITPLHQGTSRPLGLIVTRPLPCPSNHTIHQTPSAVGRGTPMLINTCSGTNAVSASGVRHAPSPVVSVPLSPRPLVRNAFVGSGQQREMTPLSCLTSAQIRPPVVLTTTVHPTTETVRLPYNVILSAPVSTTQVWPRGSTVLISRTPFAHGTPLSAGAPTVPRLSSSPALSATTGGYRPATPPRFPNSTSPATVPLSCVPTSQSARVPVCLRPVPTTNPSVPATRNVCMKVSELTAKRMQKITRLPPHEPETMIILPTGCLATDNATTRPMSFLPLAPKRFRPSPEDFDGPLQFVNTIHEDRLPIEETCPLPATYAPVEKANVVVETSRCLHAATASIQETLESVTLFAPLEETEVAHHTPSSEWCISTAVLSAHPVKCSPITLSSTSSLQQSLKRKRKYVKAVPATTASGIVEPPAKVAHLQFTGVDSDAASGSTTSVLLKSGGSTSIPTGAVQAPSIVLPSAVVPMEDLPRLPETAHSRNSSVRSNLDTPYPFLHSFNLVLHKIIPRRPLVSSAAAPIGDGTMDVEVDSRAPFVIRPSCRLLASIGRGLVCEQYGAHSEAVFRRSPYQRLAGLKPKEGGQSRDSSNRDSSNHPMQDYQSQSLPRAKILRKLVSCLSTVEVRHLAWRPKNLGAAYESTCVRRGCPFVADSFFSLSHHLENGHWLLVSLSHASLVSKPLELARNYRIVSRKLLRCGGAAAVKYSCPVCSMYFAAAQGLQTHMSKNHGIQNFHTSDASVSVRCWNCGDTTDRNQRQLVCQVAQAEDESTRSAAILQQLSSDPARAIDAHSMAVYLLCPNPEARFSLPTHLASHLLPVIDVSPMAPSFSLRYTRAISALMGCMQSCLGSDTGRTIQSTPSEKLILTNLLEDSFKKSRPLLDLSGSKTALLTSQSSRSLPAPNFVHNVISGQCTTRPLPPPPSQPKRLLLQSSTPPVRIQPFPIPSSLSTPLPPIAPKPVMFALRPRLPPSSAAPQSLAVNISTNGVTRPQIYRLVGPTANAPPLGQPPSTTSASGFASFIEAAKRQQQNPLETLQSSTAPTAVRFIRSVAPPPPRFTFTTPLSAPSTSSSSISVPFPVPVGVTTTPAVASIPPRAPESMAQTHSSLQEMLRQPAATRFLPPGPRFVSSRSSLTQPLPWPETSFERPVIGSAARVSDRALPRGPQIVCPICAFTSYERNIIMQHIVDKH